MLSWGYLAEDLFQEPGRLQALSSGLALDLYCYQLSLAVDFKDDLRFHALPLVREVDILIQILFLGNLPEDQLDLVSTAELFMGQDVVVTPGFL